MKRIFYIITALLISTSVYAQQQAMYTQYMFNPLSINPGYAGSLNELTATAIARMQWTNLEGAPNTQTFSIHGPVKYSRSSFGAQLIHDQITVSNHYGVYGFYSYYIPLSKNTRLSLGVRAGVSNYRADMTEVNAYYPEMDLIQDPVFAQDNYGGWLPNVGFGLYLYGKRAFLGISAPELINNQIETSVESIQARQVQHYFVHAGYVFDLSPALKLKPNVLLKGVAGAPLQFDLNANLLIKELIWIGASYRWEESYAAIMEIDFNKKWRIGYSYDFPSKKNLGPFHNGSHEFLISYRFIKDNAVTVTPRYF